MADSVSPTISQSQVEAATRVDWERADRYANRIAGWNDGNAEQNLARAYLSLRTVSGSGDEAFGLLLDALEQSVVRHSKGLWFVRNGNRVRADKAHPEIAAARSAVEAHVEGLRAMAALVQVPKGRDGDWFDSGLLAVGQELLRLRSEVERLREDALNEWEADAALRELPLSIEIPPRDIPKYDALKIKLRRIASRTSTDGAEKDGQND